MDLSAKKHCTQRESVVKESCQLRWKKGAGVSDPEGDIISVHPKGPRRNAIYHGLPPKEAKDREVQHPENPLAEALVKVLLKYNTPGMSQEARENQRHRKAVVLPAEDKG